MTQSTGRIQQLFKQYGRTAVGVHLAVYTASFAGRPMHQAGRLRCRAVQQHHFAPAAAGLYVAIERGLDPHKLLSQYGLLSGEPSPHIVLPAARLGSGTLQGAVLLCMSSGYCVLGSCAVQGLLALVLTVGQHPALRECATQADSLFVCGW